MEFSEFITMIKEFVTMKEKVIQALSTRLRSHPIKNTLFQSVQKEPSSSGKCQIRFTQIRSNQNSQLLQSRNKCHPKVLKEVTVINKV